MQKSEIIRLDAKVVDMIAVSVFRAELANGHRFIAYTGKRQNTNGWDLKAGDGVTVEMSPYDMSRGKIINRTGKEACHESSKFS